MFLSTLDMLPRLGLPYPLEGLGSITLTVFMFFLSQTLQRHRLLDLHEFLGKIVVVTALGLVLVAIYGGLVSWVGDRPELFYFNTVVASFVILSLFEPMRERVEEWVVATLFRERYELVRRLELLRHRTGNVIEPAGLAEVVLDGLVETRRVTHASLWLVADDRPGYRLLDFRGPPPVPFLEPATARALLGASAATQKAILLENIDRRVAELRAMLPPGPAEHESRGGRGAPAAVAEELTRLGDARAVMGSMRAGICMPLLAGDRVVGFLACWDERVPEAFASDEIAAPHRGRRPLRARHRELEALPADEGARPPRRARRDVGRPRPRDPQPARRHQGRRPVPRSREAPRRGPRVPRDRDRGGEPPERRRHRSSSTTRARSSPRWRPPT